MRRTLLSPLVVISVGLCLAILCDQVAQACSAPMPIRHTLRWTDAGLLVLGGPEGKVLRLLPEGRFAQVPVSGETLEHMDADFSADGKRLVVLRPDFSDQSLGIACEATFVFVEVVDLDTGAREVVKRHYASGGVRARFSPSGARVLAWIANREGAIYGSVYDLASKQRLRVHDSPDAVWLSDDLIAVVTGEDGGLRVVDAATGGWRHKVPPPAAGNQRAPLPGDATPVAFSAVEQSKGAYRVLRVQLQQGKAARVEAASWTTALEPFEVSRDGARVLARPADGREQIVVLARDSGARLATVSGQYRYTAATFSPDGARIAVMSHEALTREDQEAGIDPSAFKAISVEVFDLATGGTVVHHGAKSASKLVLGSGR